MRKYEFTFVLRTSVKDVDAKKFFETAKEWLGKDIAVVKEDDWGQKPLAYAIKKESAGHYYMWELEGEIGIPTDFETKVFRNENILRHLVLRTK
jgi:small subunit ribosomal protein S6